MRIALVNPVSQTSPSRWTVPHVTSNRQSIGVQIARELERIGHECTVVMAEPYRPDVSDEGVRCVYLPSRSTPLSPPSLLTWMPSLGRCVLELGADVVVTSEVLQWSTSALCGLRERGGPPVVVWQEADRYQRFGATVPARLYHGSIGRRVLRAADGFLPRSERARDFLEDGGVSAARIGPEIPNGVDTTVFHPLPGSRDPRPLVLHVGTLLMRKNPVASVEAFAEILRERPNARLVIKGSGEAERRVAAAIRRLGVGHAARIDTGRSTPEEMARLYNRAWVALFPTKRDLATLSPVEALACGVPAVVSGRLSHAEALAGLGASVPPADDPSAFASAAVELMTRFESGGLPAEEVARVCERYSLEAVAQRLSAYVESRFGATARHAEAG